MSDKLTDDQLVNQNLGHIPGGDPSPVDTHVTPTPRESVMYGEIAAGAAAFDPNPTRTFTPVTNDWDQSQHLPGRADPIIESFRVGEPNPTPTGAMSGCTVRDLAVGSDTTGPVKKLFVGNLPFGGLSIEDLRAHFAQCGEVIDVQTRRDRNHMPSIAFITFARESDARRALVKLQGSILDGRALDVQVAARQE